MGMAVWAKIRAGAYTGRMSTGRGPCVTLHVDRLNRLWIWAMCDLRDRELAGGATDTMADARAKAEAACEKFAERFAAAPRDFIAHMREGG